MILVRLSGHSGAGKSRLLAALPQRGIECRRAVLYTSRLPRDGESHGRDYYFASRGAIAALPADHFLVGPVHETIQAVDLSQLEQDLRHSSVVLIEIYEGLWPDLERALRRRIGGDLETSSIFMTAVDPAAVRRQVDDASRAAFIEAEVAAILTNRGKNNAPDIDKRSRSAVREISEAIGPRGSSLYARVIHSAPEGPDGKDEWTRAGTPIGRAKAALDEFVDLLPIRQ